MEHHGGWLEAEVFETHGSTVTCTYEVDGMTGYREIDDSETSMMRPLGRRVARGTLTTTTSSSYASSIYSDATSRHGGRLELEPESDLHPDCRAKLDRHPVTPAKQRDSLVDAVSRIEQEGREFQELALSYLVSGSLLSGESGSTPVLPRGTGATPRLARLAQQHARRDPQRVPSMSDPLDEVRFNVGDQVWIYSNSENEWVVGEVESIYVGDSTNSSTDAQRTIVRVMYWAGDAKRGKDISANDRGLLRPMDGARPRAPAE